ncbi:MAG: tyrosine-type recombinase/integrase [Bacillota bacterium]
MPCLSGQGGLRTPPCCIRTRQAVAGGSPRMRLHHLGHPAATRILDQGVPVHMVAVVLGHASVTVTQQVYAPVLEQKKKEPARAIDDFLAAHGEWN